ncbi:MAG: hypothetical protein JO099_16285 [Acidobacteriia bacterium]|nr:hypothetical protein [Terriglobia bacterium]
MADRRIRDANDGARRVVVELYPDFSSPGNGMPKMMILQWTKLVPGRGGEFLAILDSDLMPAMRKLARYHLLARVALGEAQYQLLRFTGMENYATLDADSFAKTMGAENQAYRARLERLTLEVREDVYRYLPELSYQPVGSSK